LGAEQGSLAAHVMVDDVVGMTEAAVQNRPTKRRHGLQKTENQDVLFLAHSHSV
jgi:hypothetical protein